ncbi:UDP-N-acetylmuramoyl-L-alanyl-D-glutamate--2,6-diaminopimelate ligase [Cohnella sp. JJ-181]|uniref:UDP-N-acetylmuramoyl-L-alanyl-D-glutamate--2, 6-diaminopimelate ligase n=1 Tax=Cohnella rhizoplanae TaxID=2974897 RepID=UPI0022FF6251|nr:UDP-N-acetylmuramoyl-L-alanyl-D-glutamate--2,6-diaminopimelate ligase [Cohnella sp. JJ-181]CAI6020118.1 UDP-N-acetylmuramoyl-L-alanyl-D-glutamate--2, 6-diaminopimelate ligase [Cohnella sp. JJ-181]
MRLNQLAKELLLHRIIGDDGVDIRGIESDSRAVEAGQLFFCLPGHRVDGHDFAPQALERGAAALVVSRELPLPAPQLVVPDVRRALAVLADSWYGHPSRKLRPIGVTGTNGKTTTTYLIERILSDAGISPGVIGTIEARYAGNSYPMSGTTPDIQPLQRLLGAMADAGTERAVMEVSSHALEQGRTWGTKFKTAIFTNLTQDHLDYHVTMEAYAAAKGLFFSRLGNDYGAGPEDRAYAVLNADDEVSAKFARLTAAEIVTYGIDREADVRATNLRISSRGTSFDVETFRGSRPVQLRMVGKFNAYNALASLAAALVEGIGLDAAVASLEAVPGVPGRVEAVDEGQPYAVVVDYAHTPDGLDNVLRAVREIAEGKVICVFGCGGDRDRTKRPIMGRIAAELADVLLVTSDNPRTEDPIAILEDIEAGLKEDAVDPDRYELEPDRGAAIRKAVEMASPGDVVLIAGKGHETYQIIGGVTHDFDDRLTARDAIRSRML